MMLLAIDTSASLCAAAVLDMTDGTVRSSVTRDIGKGHAEVLMDVIGEALATAAISYGDLSRIAVTVGPGSFTGVRIGVSAARGLGLALAVPVIGVTTLEAIAAMQSRLTPGRPVLAVIDAGRGEVYAAVHAPDGSELRGPAILAIGEAAALADGQQVLAGSGAGLVASAAGVAHPGEVAASTGDIALVAALAADKDPATNPARPLYLRGAGAKPQSGFALPRKAG